ncbi:MAG TPA: prephenate dehydratase [Paludibacteraceae bacterium]|nr:prephenate dehydratase [Paludibacteraceae bacterium]HQB68718.1 prephenate dehydratase [Paludibacteraceae bacterium]
MNSSIQVAIQGAKGSFHDIVSRLYFGNDIEILPCDTFKESIDLVRKNPTIVGAIAIENTIAGSLLQNYNLIKDSDLRIFGEHKLRIKHSLVALDGQDITNIREVHSHHMALLQCEQFLSEHPHIQLVESDDTAKSAYEIATKKQFGIAGICHADTAKQFGLKILAEGIETNKHNFTRFLMVAHKDKVEKMVQQEQCNKASLVFSLPHEQGSLSKVLTVLSCYHINLTKIQSLPIIGQEWEYLFYIDLSFENYLRYTQAVDAIRPLIRNIKILGEYSEGEQTI